MSRPRHTTDTETPESALREFFHRVQPVGVASVYLYGSAARGQAHAESDVDVAVLLDRASFPSREQRSGERVRLTAELIHVLRNNDVDLVILNDVPPGLGRHAVTEGIRVYVADSEADHAFFRDVQLRAADLEPFLRRMRQIKLRTLSS
ncbi:MAG: nucleotidyltransferase domain-containing protein [Gemmatimonadetes bacterium]|nr:nucleotidyltransferase domain-containing protein [Gemmatimonadota bacterium]